MSVDTFNLSRVVDDILSREEYLTDVERIGDIRADSTIYRALHPAMLEFSKDKKS